MTCKLICDPWLNSGPEKKWYEGHYWDHCRNLNKVCTFDASFVVMSTFLILTISL